MPRCRNMTSSFDSFDRFKHLRASAHEDVEAKNPDEIDDMLESLERVFGGARDPGEKKATLIRVCLTRLLDELDSFQSVLDGSTEPRLTRFLAATRETVRRLLRCGWRHDAAPVAGAIEIELGYDDHHDFMMAPDLEQFLPKAS